MYSVTLTISMYVGSDIGSVSGQISERLWGPRDESQLFHSLRGRLSGRKCCLREQLKLLQSKWYT